MKKFLLPFIVMILTIFCWGCTGGSQGQEKEAAGKNADSRAMGRYVEEEITLPPDVSRYTGITKMEDKSLTLFDYNTGACRSKDEGNQWEQEDSLFMQEKYFNSYIRNVAIAPDGSSAMIYESIEEEQLDGEIRYLYVTKEGEEKELDLGLTHDEVNYLQSLWFSPDNRLYGVSIDNLVYEINTDSSSVKLLLEGEGEIEYLTFQRNLCIGISTEGVYLYDLEKKTLLSKDTLLDQFVKEQMKEGIIAYPDGSYSVMVAPSTEEQVFYIACRNGLYRYVLYGNAMEQVIDGALTTFGDPMYAPVSVQEITGGEYLVLFSGGKLIKYTYDENMPTVPEGELKIYSLEDNHVVRQAVSSFQKQHQDTYVRYVAGVSNTDGVTVEDAIKKLNTELMSGNGPDVLVLDDMQISSLLEKGLLSDIGGVIGEISSEKPIPEHFVDQFEEDGKIYMFPARFKIPLLAGPKEYIDEITDLESLADAVEKIREERPDGSIMGLYKPQQALKVLGMVSDSQWLDENQGIQKDAITEFLTQAKRIYQAELSGITEEDIRAYEGKSMQSNTFSRSAEDEAFYLNISNSMLDILTDQAVLAAGYTEVVSLDFSLVISVLMEKQGYAFRELGGQQKNTLLPNTVMGISAKSEKQELAQDFLKQLFLEDQGGDNYGYPVNKEAYQTCMVNPHGGDNYGAMGYSDANGDFQTLECRWPKEEDIKKLAESVDQGILYLENSVVSSMVYSEIGQRALLGDISIEKAVEEICQKLNIYLLE